MSDGTNEHREGDTLVPLQNLPTTAIQAIYHAVTGKTENLSKSLKKNVVIKYSDFEQLYYRITQQMGHYQLLARPTITIIVKQADSKTLQYSSWERFREFQINSSDITSEIGIKFEFIMQLANTTSPQRCIVNISLDSGLPILHSNETSRDLPFFEFFFFVAQEFRTVEISIDFVDFLIAKIFANVVEEWFGTLETAPRPIFTTFLIKNLQTINSLISHFGKIGVAVFLASYVWFNQGVIGNPGKFVYSVSLALILWSFFAVASSSVTRRFSRRLYMNVVPSVIILTEGDHKAYEKIKNGLNSSYNTAIGIVSTGFINVILNIFASYVYTYLSKS